MKTENETPQKRVSFMISCPRSEAEIIVSGLRREAEEKREMTMVIDGEKVEPQKNIAENAMRMAEGFESMPEWGWAESLISVEAGLYVAIMDKLIKMTDPIERIPEETKKKLGGTDYDFATPKKRMNLVANYRWEDADKVEGAATSLDDVEKAVDAFDLERITVVIKNFDKIEYPTRGPMFNRKLAESFLEIRHDKLRVILFREGND